MQSPDRRQGKGQRRLAKNQYAQGVYQRDVGSVQNQVHPVIARRVRSVAENRVIHEVRKRGQRTVQIGGGLIYPIAFRKNAVGVLQGCLVDTRVLQDRRFVVVNKTGIE